ncbi:MAG: hypothetical protein WB511_10740 [Nitrososphaeraceae archaeon]
MTDIKGDNSKMRKEKNVTKLEYVPSKGKEDHTTLSPSLEHDIECPRCYNIMTLCSDFDSLYYMCEECDFCLYTIKKSPSITSSNMVSQTT